MQENKKFLAIILSHIITNLSYEEAINGNFLNVDVIKERMRRKKH